MRFPAVQQQNCGSLQIICQYLCLPCRKIIRQQFIVDILRIIHQTLFRLIYVLLLSYSYSSLYTINRGNLHVMRFEQDKIRQRHVHCFQDGLHLFHTLFAFAISTSLDIVLKYFVT